MDRIPRSGLGLLLKCLVAAVGLSFIRAETSLLFLFYFLFCFYLLSLFHLLPQLSASMHTLGQLAAGQPSVFLPPHFQRQTEIRIGCFPWLQVTLGLPQIYNVSVSWERFWGILILWSPRIFKTDILYFALLRYTFITHGFREGKALKRIQFTAFAKAHIILEALLKHHFRVQVTQLR